MKGRILWAVMAIAIAMVINFKPALAQGVNKGGGGECVAVDKAAVTLEELCKLAQYAGCPTCARYKPCTDGACNAAAGNTAAPAAAPITWTYSQQCEENHPAVAGARMDGGKCVCAEHYKPITVGNKAGANSSPTVRHNILIKRCVPTDRNEKAVEELQKHQAAIDDWIKKLLEGEIWLKNVLEQHAARLDGLEAEIGKMKADIEAAKGMAFTANVKVDALAVVVNAILNGLTKLDAELQRTKEVVPTIEAGYQLAGRSRGSDAGSGITHSVVVGWTQRFDGSNANLWIQAHGGVLSCSACNPMDAGRASMFHGGADVGVGYEFGKERGFSLRGGLGVSVTSAPDQMKENGMGRSIGPSGQACYHFPGTSIRICGVGGVSLYNRQNYFDLRGGQGAAVAHMDNSMGGHVGLQLLVVSGFNSLGF